jgi:hypothetical protein
VSLGSARLKIRWRETAPTAFTSARCARPRFGLRVLLLSSRPLGGGHTLGSFLFSVKHGGASPGGKIAMETRLEKEVRFLKIYAAVAHAFLTAFLQPVQQEIRP